MATVTHSVPSRMTHLTAELYGHDNDTLIAWQHFCAQAAEALHTQHGSDRLGKALALAQQRAVELEDDGFAVVTSATKLYHVQTDGTCDCPDYEHRGAPCKHVLAVLIHTRAQALLAPSPSVAAEPAAPPTLAPVTPKRPAKPRHAPASTPAAPAVPTSAAWHVQEAPTSACFKWRVGQAELMYTFRGVTDEEVLDRIREHLPLLQDILDACETRAAERAAARDAALAQAQQAQAQAQHAQPPAGAPADLQALLQQAVQQALNGQAPSTPPPVPPSHGTAAANGGVPFCHVHQAPLELRTNDRGSWWSHWVASEKRYCKGE